MRSFCRSVIFSVAAFLAFITAAISAFSSSSICLTALASFGSPGRARTVLSQLRGRSALTLSTADATEPFGRSVGRAVARGVGRAVAYAAAKAPKGPYTRALVG